MKKFNYQYDYQFLSNWLNENKNIRRKNVMEVLEMSDYKTFQNWTEGKTIMPPSQMMRFCNYYSVPIECFFVNKVDVKQSQIDGTIESNDKWEHFDGRTGTHVYDPTCTMHFESYLSDNNESIIPDADIIKNTIIGGNKHTYKYQYNYDFFKDYMEANENISKSIILKALGFKSYVSLQRWIDGEVPLPIECMIKFCNYFNICIGNFIQDINFNKLMFINNNRENETNIDKQLSSFADKTDIDYIANLKHQQEILAERHKSELLELEKKHAQREKELYNQFLQKLETERNHHNEILLKVLEHSKDM